MEGIITPRYAGDIFASYTQTTVRSCTVVVLYKNSWFGLNMDQDWLSDLQRAGGTWRALFREQSLWAIWVYRFGRRVDKRPDGIRKKVMTRCYWILYRLAETFTGIGLPKAAEIGPGLRIWHFGGIFIHPGVVIGRNCTLRQGVTLGDRGDNGAAPVIGDNVDFGSCAHVIGPVHLGSNVKVGALAMVVASVPDGCTVVGNPARVVRRPQTDAPPH